MTSSETVIVGMKIGRNSIDIAIAPTVHTENDRDLKTISPDLLSFADMVQELKAQYPDLHFVHEAGSCGYKYFSYLASQKLPCSVVVLRERNNQTSDRDALQLARLQRAGKLTGIYVPQAEDDAMRDLVRCSAAARMTRRFARNQVQTFLKRQGMRPEEGWTWSAEQWRWLESLTFPRSAQSVAFREYLNMVLVSGLGMKRLEQQMETSVKNWRMRPLIEGYQALRGVNLLTAVTIAAELGDLRRFDNPGKLCRYADLFSDRKFSRGKDPYGQHHGDDRFGLLGTVLFEAAWAYSKPAGTTSMVSRLLTGQPKPIIEISRQAELRLCSLYRELTYAGKNHEQALTEIARKLLSTIWTIAQEVKIN